MKKTKRKFFALITAKKVAYFSLKSSFPMQLNLFVLVFTE